MALIQASVPLLTMRIRVCNFFADGCYHRLVGMAEYHGSPGVDVVDVLLIVCIEEVGAFGALHEYRVTANAFEGTYRRVNTTWYA